MVFADYSTALLLLHLIPRNPCLLRGGASSTRPSAGWARHQPYGIRRCRWVVGNTL